MIPGTSHACKLLPDAHKEAIAEHEAHQLAALLAKNGYEVTRRSKTVYTDRPVVILSPRSCHMWELVMHGEAAKAMRETGRVDEEAAADLASVRRVAAWYRRQASEASDAIVSVPDDVPPTP